MRDLYREAVSAGTIDYHWQTGTEQPAANGETGPQTVGYWIARHAARQTAIALLDAARQAGVTDAQWEALRVVAADVAYD